MATPKVRGGSQARGRIRAASQPQQHQFRAVSATYTTARSNAILNPVREEAKDRTCILMDPSRVLNPLSHNVNSQHVFLKLFPPCMCPAPGKEANGDYAQDLIIVA